MSLAAVNEIIVDFDHKWMTFLHLRRTPRAARHMVKSVVAPHTNWKLLLTVSIDSKKSDWSALEVTECSCHHLPNYFLAFKRTSLSRCFPSAFYYIDT